MSSRLVWCVAQIAIALGVCGMLAAGGTSLSAQRTELSTRAHWIDASAPMEGLPLFRKGFVVRRSVTKAELMISGLGQFEAHINGRNVTDAVLTPGWTDYRKQVLYDTYDVTALLHPGANAVGVMLGNGMYNVATTPGRYTKFVGSFGPPKMIALLRITYRDGSEQLLASDATWKTKAGPIVFSSAYGGEDYDARLEQPGWDTGAFDDAGWTAASLVDGPGGVLEPEMIPAVRVFDRFEPIRVTHTREGVTVYDLGQNFAGWPEIEVEGERGSSVTMIAGELLNEDGTVSQHSANASPKSENAFRYVLRGDGVERWHPRFSYYGFRYVQVESSPLTLLRVSGRFLHDDVLVDGRFTSSDELLNRIHGLIDRAILSNTMSVLTDCPHREKLGWLEQTHLAGAALMYNYNLRTLYEKISGDMSDAQLESGMVPDIAPEYTVFPGAFRDSPEWGAAVVLSPWVAYQFYGDVENLRAHYGSMQRYAAYLKSRSKAGPVSYGLGDWYDVGPKPPGQSQLTSPGVTGTATYYELLTDLERIAKLLGHAGDARRYAEERVAVKKTFNAKFFHEATNEYDTGSQTANAMPLVVGLVPDGHRSGVLDNLVADIRRHGEHVTAGDVGFHYVVRALTDGDRSDVLYAMLLRRDSPSYGYQLDHGATALTEAWDANPDSSQNHFMLGHAEEWFYRGLAGIDFDLSRKGAERIRIHPSAPLGLQSAGATYISTLGRIESSWRRTEMGLELDLVIPVGTCATLRLPDGFTTMKELNGSVFRANAQVRALRTGGSTEYLLAGGMYRFSLAP